MTTKQRRFVEEFCVDFNGAAAARRAGYSERTAYAIAAENLRKPHIKAAIAARLDELSMTAGEATKRLADWGRGDVSPFLRVTESGRIVLDLSTEEAQANLHLIKEIKQTRAEDDEDGVVLKTEIKLHDAKDAVIQLAKIHGLYIDRVEHSGEINGGVLVVPAPAEADEWTQLARRQQTLAAAHAKRNGDG